MESRGRFVWHDLMTTDAKAAHAFYPELFGWKLDEISMAGFKVSLIRVGDRRIGSIIPEEHLPSSHWIPYVSVEDVDATCKSAAQLGGEVCIRPTEIPKLGRFAIVNDPQGGFFSPLRRPPDAPSPPALGAQHAPGEFCWDELLTTDPEKATAFYRDLFGWTVEKMDMPEHAYWLMKLGGHDVAGAMQQPPDAGHRPFWLPYIAVADVDASASLAGKLGARFFVEPRDIPHVGRFAVAGDPSGATFALYRSARG